ncbi:CobW family GTP-binding protein [Halalkalibacter alkalisediminis]|uniref:CobW family GTP-binding protein n=1 Tax=Halalkalibacter alkalisediminis TaxID=935616 RepID=A0ABV6NBQ0_9BACI|nr:GTP-binding protein [Halalkalibacter alkalisediminis]
MNNRIPVFILTGFLGSGKTTVLKRMLTHEKGLGKNPALILNELGSENVEKELFEDESMIEMLNGCICCTIQDDMKSELVQLLNMRQDVDVLLIEGTGIANPREIVEALTHPDLIDQVDIQSVIGLVDASRYLEYQSIFQSSKEIRVMLKQQVTSSTLIIMNKMDLLDDKKMKKVIAKVEDIKRKDAPIAFSTFGDVATEVLFAKRFQTETINLKENTHHHHHHSHPFQALKISGFEAVSKGKFKSWLNGQEQSLVRAKGYVRFQEDDTLYSFQYASGQLQLIPLESNSETCMILIGSDLDQNALTSSFDQFVRQIH